MKRLWRRSGRRRRVTTLNDWIAVRCVLLGPAWLFIGALLRLDFTSALTFDEAIRSQGALDRFDGQGGRAQIDRDFSLSRDVAPDFLNLGYCQAARGRGFLPRGAGIQCL